MRLPRVDWPILARDQLMVVCDPGDVANVLRRRYTQFNVSVSPTYLAGIASLAGSPARGLVVGVDPNARKLENAVAGLRKAAGEATRIVLCCRPSGEPAARRILSAGANDYLIYPPRGEELDRALGLAVPRAGNESMPMLAADETTPTWEEIAGLANVLAGMGDGRQALLDRLCRWVADSMRTADVRIVAGDESALVGDPSMEPTLVETITAGGRQIGEVLVGPRQKAPYSLSEVEKLRHYGRMIANLLDAAEQQRRWQSLAMVDEVTQLPNRRYLIHSLDQLLLRAAQQRFRVTVLAIDLDGFKHFNDTYGHAAGDQIRTSWPVTAETSSSSFSGMPTIHASPDRATRPRCCRSSAVSRRTCTTTPSRSWAPRPPGASPSAAAWPPSPGTPTIPRRSSTRPTTPSSRPRTPARTASTSSGAKRPWKTATSTKAPPPIEGRVPHPRRGEGGCHDDLLRCSTDAEATALSPVARRSFARYRAGIRHVCR